MKPELKQRWVEALRSGEFKQTYGALANEHGHCCLGVACEVFKDDLTPPIEAKETVSPGMISYDGDDAILAQRLADYLELSPTGHLSTPVEGYHKLSVLNDSGKYTFAQIADIIEEQF